MQIKDFLKEGQKIFTPDMQREEIIRRMKRAGTYREAGESTAAIFAACKGSRTPKKVRNTFSREEAGTCGQVIRTKYFSASRVTVTYRTINTI